MALNDKSNRTITDLKATFFDLFRDHTGDIVTMIETLANGDSNNAVSIETSIFQRIILLNKTANSIDGLQKNIEDLALLKSDNHIKNTNALTKDSGNSTTRAATSDSKPAATSTTNPGLNVVNTSNAVSNPSVSNTPSKITNKANFVNALNRAVTTPTASNQNYQINEKKPVNVPVKEESNPVIQPVYMNSTEKENSTIQKKNISAMQEKKNFLEKSQGIVKESIEKPSPLNVAKKRAFDEPGRLFRLSDKKVKAILVNDRQFKNLMASRQRQFVLLDFNTNSPEIVESRIARLMKKASSLYKEGKVSEAQAMYTEISELNKKLNQQQGSDKLLIKKAA